MVWNLFIFSVIKDESLVNCRWWLEFIYSN